MLCWTLHMFARGKNKTKAVSEGGATTQLWVVSKTCSMLSSNHFSSFFFQSAFISKQTCDIPLLRFDPSNLKAPTLWYKILWLRSHLLYGPCKYVLVKTHTSVKNTEQIPLFLFSPIQFIFLWMVTRPGSAALGVRERRLTRRVAPCRLTANMNAPSESYCSRWQRTLNKI